MKISYIMIVLNGMPFIKASLAAIYDFAHEIIIAEGAVEKCRQFANLNGHSIDGTLDFVHSFPDPDHKIKIIHQEPCWLEKCKMQNMAIRKVTGDWIWLVDSDEVYKKEDIKLIVELLKSYPVYYANLPLLHFWKGGNYIIDSEKLNTNNTTNRIFKAPPDSKCRFTTHRPPTLLWKTENVTTNSMMKLGRDMFSNLNIFLYHYSYVTKSQVKQKIELYKKYGWEEPWKIDLDDWYKNCFLKWTPKTRYDIEAKYGIWTCDKTSRTKLFEGTHPETMKGIL